ncbi:MAG TPA: hypothetical protein VHH36_04755 [Candidatus Thermoplasmatota archaeon]|nr:hypothetical protein [Candidatus Thermoplasmatota archaeon]
MKSRTFAALLLTSLIYFPSVTHAAAPPAHLGTLTCFGEQPAWIAPEESKAYYVPRERDYTFLAPAVSDGTCVGKTLSIIVNVTESHGIGVTPGSVTVAGSASCTINPIACTANATIRIVPPTVWVYVCVHYYVDVDGIIVATGWACIYANIP